MTKKPPLPDTLTLPEAAQAMTERTGIEWTERHILGRAVHHEVQINARIGHAVRLIRSEPIEGEESEFKAAAGCLPPLSSKSVQALLNSGEAGFDGWEHPKTVIFFGKPMATWAMEYELAPGEIPPVVHFDNCRIIVSSLLQLAERYTAPATDTVKPVGKKWTPEKLAELKAYREAHTMPETAAKFGISEQRIRGLLPSAKKKAKPFAGLIHRL